MSEINTPRNILEQTFFFAPLKKPLSVFQMQMEYEHLRNELIASQQKCAEMIKEATQQRNRAMDAESERDPLKQRVGELERVHVPKKALEDTMRDCINYLRKQTVTTQLSAIEGTDGSITDTEPAAQELIDRIRTHLTWTVEDPRMLREQIRVADEAFNHLQQRFTELKSHLAALEQDGKMLDWIESHFDGCGFDSFSNNHFALEIWMDEHHLPVKFRTAIIAAMKGETK